MAGEDVPSHRPNWQHVAADGDSRTEKDYV